ncbi:alpha/beta fold hydrolase [Kribbella sp. NPDC051620]|uniref:alpha/beta fold hydrolase n=1 Tax=Kribbella sp. NPDC051620 TaxID=3364120 RepID=UPI0037B98D07
MSHFVLAHGGWHDTWCWDPLVRALEARGHRATAVHLPSDETGQGAEAYAAAIATGLEPSGSIVVGHSLAGLALPLVPILSSNPASVPASPPGVVTALVFLAALLPEPGRSWREQLADGRPMAPWFYAQGLPRQRRDDEGRTYWPTDAAAELFFHDCDPQLAAAAAGRLRPQAPTPVEETTPVSRFPDLPTAYIMGREDRAVSPEWVRATVPERLGIAPTWIDGGHSPFLARPAELADVLTGIAASARAIEHGVRQ